MAAGCILIRIRDPKMEILAEAFRMTALASNPEAQSGIPRLAERREPKWESWNY
jgi:hypothetical protein